MSFEVLEVPDPPAVTTFDIPQSYASKTVPITTFEASNSPTGYLVNQASSPPAIDDSEWTVDPPTDFVFGAVGLKWLYPWAKNEGGVSANGDNKRKSVFVFDPVPPVVSAFDLPLQSNSLTVSINLFDLTGVYITGYLLTETSDEPDEDDPAWQVNPWTSYTFGTDGVKTLYAWGKNPYGISDPVSDQVTIILPAPGGGFQSGTYLKFDSKVNASRICLPDGTPWGYAEFDVKAGTTKIYLEDGTLWGYLEYDEKVNGTKIYLAGGTLWGYWKFDAKADRAKIYLADGTLWGESTFNGELGRPEIRQY